MLPNKKHELSAGWRAAQKSGPAGYTTGLADGLHIKGGQRAAHVLGCGKGRSGGLPFSAARPALFAARRTAFLCSPPFCLVFCAARQQFTFIIWKHGPPISVIPN